MKKLVWVVVISIIFLTTLTTNIFAQTIPIYTGYVNDYGEILNNDEVIEQKISEFEKSSTVEIAVLTVRTFEGATVEDYAVKVFENWKIGKEDIDNGVLILVSAQERKARIEVGYGIEGTITDSMAGRILDEFAIPYFSQDDYSTGVLKTVEAVIGVLNDDPTVVSSITNNNTEDFRVTDFLVIFIFFGIYIMAATKNIWWGGVFGLILGIYFTFVGFTYLLILVLPVIGLLLDLLLSRTPLGHILIYSTNSVTSFGGSSGGVSFGGGSSGGGGASRGW